LSAEEVIVRDYLDFEPFLRQSALEILEAAQEEAPLVTDRIQTVRASLGRLRGLAAAGRELASPEA